MDTHRQEADRSPSRPRDRFLDSIRVISMLLVVFGHWFIASVWWVDGRIGANSSLGSLPQIAWASWLFMSVPLFFFVGGVSNIVSLRRLRSTGDGVLRFHRARARRLLPPTLVFIASWAVIQGALHAIGLGGEGLVRGVRIGGTLPFGPLWFLGVYLPVVALTPITSSLHERFGVLIPVGLAVSAALVDIARFGLDEPAIGWANLGVTWLFAHQLGFFYADGRLRSKGQAWILTLAGFVALFALTVVGPYPVSIGGTRSGHMSNMNPPTIMIVALTSWQVGLVMVAKPALDRWLAGARAWRLCEALNRTIMTTYLWHMTAYLIAVVMLAEIGVPPSPAPSEAWWWQRPLWIAVPATVTVGLVALVGRVESRPVESRIMRPPPTVRVSSSRPRNREARAASDVRL